MGRRKSVRELERQVQYARAREAYNPPLREEGSVTRRQPKRGVKYNSCMEEATSFTIQASDAGIDFFGGLAALGLAEPADDPTAPRGFRPSTIHATVGDASPSVVRALGSNRPYIRYTRGTRGGNVQSSFSAPLSTADATTLVSEIRTAFNTIHTAKKASLGGTYGRMWLEIERLPLFESGG